MYHRRFLTICLLGLLFAAATHQSKQPGPILIAGKRGSCYVKSVPPNQQGRGGGTRVYLLGNDKDQLLQSFDWYSSSLAIKCGFFDPRRKNQFSPALVRMSRGWKGEIGGTPRAVTLAFYLDGKVLAEYSRMDIVSLARRTIGSADSWRGYWRPLGFGSSNSRASFEICTIDGRTLAFDISTGQFINQVSDHKKRCESQVAYPSQRPNKITTAYY